MTQQTINVGTVAGDNTGDPGRTAFQKINSNFNELYNASGGSVLVTSVSGTNTITGTCTGYSAYFTGSTVSFVAFGANTNATTLNINGLGAKSITKQGSTALTQGDIKSGQIVMVTYDGTRFQLIPSKINPVVSVNDFGAVGDGATDDTAAFNAALTAAKIVFVPPSTSSYIVDGISMPANSVLYATGGATLKRKNNATSSSMVLCNAINNFVIRGLRFDGNKTNQVNIGSAILIQDNTDAANTTVSVIDGNDVSNNNNTGILVYRSNSFRLTNNTGSNNTYNGITLQDPTIPVTTVPKLSNIIIAGNEFTTCAVGIFVKGNISNTTALGDVISQSKYVNAYISIANNVVYGNTQYGLACQGNGLSITGNVIQNNGNSTSNGGALFNCSFSSLTGNIVNNNKYFGIDAGFSSYSVISGNEVFSNGAGLGQAVGINAGASSSLSILSNNIGDNGGTLGGSYQILASGVDGSLTAFAPFTGLDINIRANNIVLTNANMTGIQVTNNFAGVNITENTFNNRAGGSVMAVYLPGGSTCVERNKVFNSTGNWEATATSATSMTIPDYGEVVNVTGTTNVNNIYTTAQLYGRDKVCTVVMTSNGSSYTTSPSVSLVGAGGTNATGTAALAANGSIYGVYITNYGSGYTPGGNFAVGFSGGGGAGAAATAYVGCDNATDRVVVLRFASTATIKNGLGNIYLNGADFVGSTTKTLTIRSVFGNWYEVSRT
jgi:parallel beta-helix repeat protein